MKINLGCGEFRAPDPWLNIDSNSEEKEGFAPHVVADIVDLPFKDDTVDSAFASHVLEHLFLEDVPKALAEMLRVCRSGALVAAVGPDIHRAQAMIDEGTQPPELMNDVRAGGDRWSGDTHKFDCEEELMLKFFNDVGFKDVTARTPEEIEELGFPIVSLIGWQCALTAVVP